ncbi:ankyrin repeat domain-containing protein [Brachyspira catarrhinii]|uniref:Ankyrin repeat domain-containing protein n=1 Tax=Brachyspira catarrhinii TaxID=2528966 RepID=A0ABY2TPA6_9SPIR|nr:ankyrin repeat domain-containing protein [Brachyspira catarrhinii]TKZ29069.1 ankyrin repeat domain-containing protein [Brachyspira catarrhinii]
MSFEDRLINACIRGDYKEVEATADSLGPNIDYQDNDGLTALMWASANGYLEIVEYLIREKSANPNIKNNKGKTALDLAKENRHEEVAEFLRKAGAKHGNEID